MSFFIYIFVGFWEHYQTELKAMERLGASVFSIGKSEFGRELWCVRVGSGNPKILVQCSIHAREYITAHLGIMLAKKLLREKQPGTVFFVPVANPDGVLLSQEGLSSAPVHAHHFLREVNGSEDFSLWKANGRAVDLNVNFDADWGKGISNVFRPASANYVGNRPESESETRALASLALAIRPHFTLSFHTKGEVIFWRFGQPRDRLTRDKRIASTISDLTGYPLRNAAGSVGGFKDFCIQRLGIPSLTIEVGGDSLSHPIGVKHLPEIWAKNSEVVAKSLDLMTAYVV